MESNDSYRRGTARRLTRRGFAQRCLMSAVALKVAACASVPDGASVMERATVPDGATVLDGARMDRFIAVSAGLTGVPASALDPVMAERLMTALAAMGRGDELARLLAEESETADDGISGDLIVAWYSGIHPALAADPSGGGTPVPAELVGTYAEALIWTALDFARPQGVCGGAPGHWSQPPGA